MKIRRRKKKKSHFDIPELPSASIPKPEAKVSMFPYDFDRYNEILKRMAEFGIYARSGRNEYLRPYFEAMLQFWIELYEMISEYGDGINEKIEKDFDELREMLGGYEETYRAAVNASITERVELPKNMIIKLFELHRFLISVKFKLGLGVWTTTPITSLQSMQRDIV